MDFLKMLGGTAPSMGGQVPMNPQMPGMGMPMAAQASGAAPGGGMGMQPQQDPRTQALIKALMNG
jgi:hypothetical protein